MGKARQSRPWINWLMIGLVTVTAYLLSYGPIIYLEKHGFLSMGFMMNMNLVVYYPVIWIRDHSPLGPLLEWYLEWWYSR